MDNKGFTLIEIIIVIVILGVLATLAVPRLTAQTTAATAAEAMQLFGTIKRQALSCYDTIGGSFASCNSAAELGINVPPTNKFTYEIESAPTTQLIIGAKSVTNSGTNYINARVIGATGVMTYYTPAASVFVGIVSQTGASTTALTFTAATTF